MKFAATIWISDNFQIQKRIVSAGTICRNMIHKKKCSITILSYTGEKFFVQLIILLIANWDLKILDSDYIQKINLKFKLWNSQPTELSGLAITNVNQSYPILFSETILN